MNSFLFIFRVVLLICWTSTAICKEELMPKLKGLRIENVGMLVAYKKEERIVRVRSRALVPLRLFGDNMDQIEEVLFSPVKHSCVLFPELEPVEDFVADREMLTLFVTFPEKQQVYYICLKPKVLPSNYIVAVPIQGAISLPSQQLDVNNSLVDSNSINGAETNRNATPPPIMHLDGFFYQGVDHYKTLQVAEPLIEHILPIPLQIVIIACLLCLSGLFSGLNLGLMSLDITELKIILKAGSKKEKEYAKIIYPVRETGNYLLCTLLLGNVLVNSAISILMDDLTSGLIALFAASFGIVVLGEILPQSICSRYGLAVGAKTIYITKFFMFLTAPLSWPISKLLDKILGDEVGHIYNKDRLLELIRLSKEVEVDLDNCTEVAIVSGALELCNKTVKDVMTEIRDVYMIEHDAVLDTKTVSQVIRSGFTRIPVYENTKDNVVTMLNVKDLALIDPDDKVPVKAVCQFYQHPIRFILEDTPLNVLLEEFKKGHYHMAFVQKISCNAPGDPVYELVGIITLEDIIEEILQAEIMDETDVITDNRRRLFRREAQLKDLTMFTEDTECYNVSPQMAVATYQYLTTAMQAFSNDMIASNVLQRLIKQNVVINRAAEVDSPPKYLYVQDKPADYFILILEGRVEVKAGRDSFIFEGGPFFYFGRQVIEALAAVAPKLVGTTTTVAARNELLKGASFVPDFTVRLTQDVVYLQLKASAYLLAFRTTMIERGKEFPNMDALINSQLQLLSESKTVLNDVGSDKSASRKQSLNVDLSNQGSFDINSNPSIPSTPLNPDIMKAYMSRKGSKRHEPMNYPRSLSIAGVEKFFASKFGSKGIPSSQEDLSAKESSKNADEKRLLFKAKTLRSPGNKTVNIPDGTQRQRRSSQQEDAGLSMKQTNVVLNRIPSQRHNSLGDPEKAEVASPENEALLKSYLKSDDNLSTLSNAPTPIGQTYGLRKPTELSPTGQQFVAAARRRASKGSELSSPPFQMARGDCIISEVPDEEDCKTDLLVSVKHHEGGDATV